MNRGQGKAWLQSLLLLLLLCVMEAARSGYSIERLTLFAADGAASWHDDQVIAPGGNLAASGLVGVQFSAETDANGDHTWVWTLSNVSGAAIGSLRFTSFLDVDLSAPDNTFSMNMVVFWPWGHRRGRLWLIAGRLVNRVI